MFPLWSTRALWKRSGLQGEINMASLKLLSPHSEKILAALQYQGQTNDCGPFTTATVINALRGSNLEANLLARHMDRPVWRGPRLIIRRVPNWATFPWGMVDVMREHDLKASWRLLRNPDYLKYRLSVGDVLLPVTGSWKPLWAHVMTLVAWDEEKGWGFANTQFSHHNIHWLENDTFLNQWRAFGKMVVRVEGGA